jgi:hypothetical protein
MARRLFNADATPRKPRRDSERSRSLLIIVQFIRDSDGEVFFMEYPEAVIGRQLSESELIAKTKRSLIRVYGESRAREFRLQIIHQ